MFGRSLNARERRTVRLASVVAALSLVLAFVIMPVARRWSAREDALGAARDRVQRLRALIRDADTLRREADARESHHRDVPVQLIRARTPALAGSTLQGLLQDLAARSRVSVTRLDVATDPNSSGAERVVPASISAVTDIYGVADFLTRLQQGPTLLDVREVRVSSTSALRGELLQVALTVWAPYVLEP